MREASWQSVLLLYGAYPWTPGGQIGLLYCLVLQAAGLQRSLPLLGKREDNIYLLRLLLRAALCSWGGPQQGVINDHHNGAAGEIAPARRLSFSIAIPEPQECFQPGERSALYLFQAPKIRQNPLFPGQGCLVGVAGKGITTSQLFCEMQSDAFPWYPFSVKYSCCWAGASGSKLGWEGGYSHSCNIFDSPIHAMILQPCSSSQSLPNRGIRVVFKCFIVWARNM